MSKWTRRGLIGAGLVGGTALLVGVSLRPGQRAPALAPLVADADEVLVNSWVKIDGDNRVTAIVAHSEMGQGAQTALAQMLADELDADWNLVSFMEAPAEDESANGPLARGVLLGDAQVPSVLLPTLNGAFQKITEAMHLQITGGSTSVRSTGVYGMRVAGAAARQMLLQAAAENWQVPVAELTAADSVIRHERSGRSGTYAEFAAAAAAFTPPASPPLKAPAAFRIMGKSVRRLDIPPKVDGTAAFGIDARVDGMCYAAVVAAPVFGATVARVDDSAAIAMPGVVGVVTLDDAVAVAAEGYWQARKALDELHIEWSDTVDDLRSSEEIFAQFSRDIEGARSGGDAREDLSQGDALASLDTADTVIERSYRVPYLAHTCMEPMNALADFRDGGCEIWTGTQDPLGIRYGIAKALEVDVEGVKINNHFMGGGFGRRAKPDAAIQAARVSRALGRPVKLIWSREEDVRHDHYRPAVQSSFRAALGEDGLPLAWENLYVDKHEPEEAPHILYEVPHQLVRYVDSPTHVPFGAWRSVDHSQHGFFTESFIDELAHEAGQDPYQYRRRLLQHKPRQLQVLDEVAARAEWGEPLGEGRGRGISLQQSFGSVVGEVVEVTWRDGALTVDRVVVVVDAGFAVSPDGLTAQMESGVVYGLTAALYGEINIADGRVVEGNFDSYPALRMDKSPVIETHIINSMEPWGGAGEPGTPGIAPALANAVFSATGRRIRQLPLSRYEMSV